jgi:tetratricopeptide (TPR) repeat protein
MGNLADTYNKQGTYAQAEALFRQTLEISRRVLGPEHTNTLLCLSDFASMYQRQGKYALAETHAAQVLAGRRRAGGSEDPVEIQSAAADLALAYVSQGKFAESEPLARETLEFNERKQPDDWQRFRAESLLGATLAGQKKYAEAAPLLLEGYQGMLARKERMGAPNWYHLDRCPSPKLDRCRFAESYSEALPFSCPLGATRSGKVRQGAAQGESQESLDFADRDARLGNVQQGPPKGG